ncbi:MAG: trypsin-like serine protease [Desulfobacteraceae bacterium]|nr:trypsin-like serine protease [Desulfobacteraceae bacterium]
MAVRNKTIIFLMLVLALMTAIVFLERVILERQIKPRIIETRTELADYEKATISIFDVSAPSVVYIFTENAMSGFFGQKQVQQGAGSGFIWDTRGHVVTNYHVIRGAQRVQVRLDTGQALETTYVGSSPEYDLAVVRLHSVPSGLKPIPLGNSANLRVGQTVFAIGNPYGLSRTLTTGIISALDRRLPTSIGREVAGVIQTDAAINPGNSGGPLLDSAGQLIGVNTAIISNSGSYSGIGFAVPADIVNHVIPVLISQGKIPRPGIGIIVLDEQSAAGLGVAGVIIDRVLPGSEAAKAGLKGIDYYERTLGDIIVGINNEQVTNTMEFMRMLQSLEIGQGINLKVRRGDHIRSVNVLVMDIS